MALVSGQSFFLETGCREKTQGADINNVLGRELTPVTVGSESFARASLKISDGILVDAKHPGISHPNTHIWP